jgi:hypothetical protein
MDLQLASAGGAAHPTKFGPGALQHQITDELHQHRPGIPYVHMSICIYAVVLLLTP